MVRRSLTGLAVALSLAGMALSAQASAPPVGALPEGPVTMIQIQRGLLFALALPQPGSGLAWRGARPSDATIARPLDEVELGGKIVFTYRAGHVGSTTVVYALTGDETETAFQARYFEIVVIPGGRVQCSSRPKVAARYIVPPPPFVARIVSVQQQALAPAEPTGGGPSLKRLYRVTFDALRGNAVLPGGHRYAQYAYVARASTAAPWCFVKGGSGP